MIVEERMYTLYAHKVPEFMKTYEHEALPILRQYLGTQYCFFLNEVGTQNMIVHLWAFESFDDREKRRAAMAEDPRWAPIRAKNQPLIAHQETRIMRAPPYFEPLLRAMLKAGKA